MIKKQDLTLIIFLILTTAFFSVIISTLLFRPSKVKTKAEVVEPITNNFPLPDQTYFNKSSLNPTQLIIIGEDPANPFD